MKQIRAVIADNECLLFGLTRTVPNTVALRALLTLYPSWQSITIKQLQEAGTWVCSLFGLEIKLPKSPKSEIAKRIGSLLDHEVDEAEETKAIDAFKKSPLYTEFLNQSKAGEPKKTEQKITAFNDIRFVCRQDPFFKEIVQLYIFNVMISTVAKNAASKVRVPILLSFNLLSMYMKPQHVFHLRFFDLIKGSDKVWFPEVIYEINSRRVTQKFSRIRMVKGVSTRIPQDEYFVTPMPIDITQYLVPGPNKFKIYLDEGSDLRVVLQVVQENQISNLIESVPREAGGLSVLTRADTENKDEEGEVEEINTVLSLRCPLGYSKIKLPSRGRKCNHLAAFDLETYLVFCKEARIWHCPICNLPCAYSDLYIDNWLGTVLSQVSEDCHEVIVYPNGQYSSTEDLSTNKSNEKLNENEMNESVIVLSDSEDDYSPPNKRLKPDPYSARTLENDLAQLVNNWMPYTSSAPTTIPMSLPQSTLSQPRLVHSPSPSLPPPLPMPPIQSVPPIQSNPSIQQNQPIQLNPSIQSIQSIQSNQSIPSSLHIQPIQSVSNTQTIQAKQNNIPKPNLSSIPLPNMKLPSNPHNSVSDTSNDSLNSQANSNSSPISAQSKPNPTSSLPKVGSVNDPIVLD